MSPEERLRTFGTTARWSAHDMVAIHELAEVVEPGVDAAAGTTIFDCYVRLGNAVVFVSFHHVDSEAKATVHTLNQEPGSCRDFSVYLRTTVPLARDTVDVALSRLSRALDGREDEVRNLDPDGSIELELHEA